MNARSADYECQVDGCHEPALSYPYEVGELTITVRLCRRHEHDLVAMERNAAGTEVAS